MPPISNRANLTAESFGVFEAALKPVRRIADVMRFAENQLPRFGFAMGRPDEQGNITLLLTRPSSDLAFQFRVTSLQPDGEVLAAEIWQGMPQS